ncbi:MAG: hypothetical protein IT260_20705 [Saprospiraceae bacterium]|nr:hypothetical protein [Saprospiraceae bacterium]
MNRFLLFLLLGCIIGQASLRAAWVLHYQWDRAIYLKNCENRALPRLHCEGKCYLKKKIARSETPGQSAPQLPEGFRQFQDIQWYWEPWGLLQDPAPARHPKPLLPRYTCRGPAEAPRPGVFKPPAQRFAFFLS